MSLFQTTDLPLFRVVVTYGLVRVSVFHTRARNTEAAIAYGRALYPNHHVTAEAVK